jgi:iron complex outermembrane receptor protein
MIGTESSIDVDLIDRVEVVRGPASSLYGTNAVFAVINVITRKASNIHGVEAQGDAGSFNTYRGRLTYAGAIKGIDVVLSGSFYGSKGQKELFYPEYNSSATDDGVARHVDDDQYLQLLASLTKGGLTFRAAYNTRDKGDPTGAWGDVFNDPRNREADGHGYLDLRFEHQFGSNTTLTARTYFDRDVYDGGFVQGTNAESLLNKDFGRGESAGTEIQATTTVHERYKLVGGFEYRNDFRQQLVNYDDVTPSAIYLNVDHPSFVAAPYAEAELPFWKGLVFSPSIREDYNPRVGWMLSPRAVMNYRPRERTHLKLIYGESFRSPNAYELYYYPGNMPLKPERLRAWEGSWDQDLSRTTALSFSLFSNRMRDFIGMSTDEVYGSAFHNGGELNTAGGELELRKQWANGMSGAASYSGTFLQSGADGHGLINSPKHLGKLDLSVPLLHDKLFATLDSQYTSRRSTLAGDGVSPYTVVNLTLLGRHLTPHVDLSASLYNAMNKRFFDPAAQQHLQNAIQQDGRTFRANLVLLLGSR